ncbi:ABC transporter permease [Roseitalea porphyridii]|uniref:ABC transporter permease n=1 Tax=Roseitalea porphyridii TaxID=1852022 RepID=A0A4P6V3L4_9HYPH|nr:ABC transporter permease [Roseitalea porphyridii]QBK32087.1 ABC transporter permease [Roseitalea porphyridii]
MATLSDQIALAFRFALREVRGGLSGFYVFLACIALGTAAIGGVNAVAQAITQGIQSEGRSILGGDVRFELIHRTTTPEELATLEGFGTVAQSANTRSMARLADQSDQTLVEIKAVDDLYPLYGEFVTEPPLARADYSERDGAWGIAVQPILLERLGLAVGDTLLIGDSRFAIRAMIRSEPDALSDGIGLAPRVIMSLEALEASGLIQPGSLVERVYKIRMAQGATNTEIDAAIETANQAHPTAGWSVRTRSNAAPALAANVERFAQFLTLVGLTALVTGGVGVANAVRAFLDAKRDVIATFKCLGAPGRLVTLIYLFQIVMVGAVGIAAGLVLAALAPFAATWALAGIVPLPPAGLYPTALGLAVLFALLTILVFALIPLGRARDIPASNLFRNQTMAHRGLPRAPYVIAAAAAALLLAGLAVWFSEERALASGFLAGVAIAFVILRLVAGGVQALARRVRGVRGTSLRMAIGNIHRPGALTPSVVLALGLGLTLLVALALIDTNLRQQIAGNLPERAPNFFFVDIQSDVVEDFATLVEGEAGDAGKLVRVPMLRGRIVELNGQNVAEMELPPEGAWVLRGDRGITYAENVPENSTLSAGQWWPADHAGEPLVSFSAEEAAEIGLEIGDTVTVNVLGRNVTATIANLRQVEWESLAINFVMVFSPNTFAGAPHSWLATLTMPEATFEQEAQILSAVTRAFPSVTSVRVKDAIDLVNRVVGQLATAVRVAAAVALIASVLVLAGALAAGNRARTHDAVVLKTLGATRKTLIRTFVTEYAILGFATAVFALVAGGVAAWFVVSQIMTLPWTFRPEIAAFTVLAALVCTVGFGLLGTWRVLGQKAAPVLRNL